MDERGLALADEVYSTPGNKGQRGCEALGALDPGQLEREGNLKPGHRRVRGYLEPEHTTPRSPSWPKGTQAGSLPLLCLTAQTPGRRPSCLTGMSVVVVSLQPALCSLMSFG
ncbi:hypothetical protein ES703_41373 [subsurface metagenome]